MVVADRESGDPYYILAPLIDLKWLNELAAAALSVHRTVRRRVRRELGVSIAGQLLAQLAHQRTIRRISKPRNACRDGIG